MMFLLFTFDHYYPSGGMNDCDEVFLKEEDALAEAQRIREADSVPDFGQIVKVTEKGVQIIQQWDGRKIVEANSDFGNGPIWEAK